MKKTEEEPKVKKSRIRRAVKTAIIGTIAFVAGAVARELLASRADS